MPRLKQLDLQGYKTFATKSQFIFGDGITAIVGPNGSGKSNIADAIRWVLGEQSFALLRGKKTEDMIFAGSELRPRAGMAQVSLTFDNADGWLPIDFAEVAITRRAYRDGENEYLLNGQRVRLRDVAELLSRCGLAERTYTIIGQGLVDTALSLKAEERRALFEEAAGIGVYRDKREDALRRLDQTGHNLERAHDILAEIRPRLRLLERQAARARDYAQVKTDLEALLKVYYGFHWRQAQNQLAEAKAAAEAHDEEIAALQKEQESLDAEVVELRIRISNLRSLVNQHLRDSSHLRAERERLARDLAVADERLRSLTAQREEAEAELVPLQTELDEANRRVESARAELSRLQAELDQARRESAEAARLSASGEAERRALAEREAAARARAQHLAAQIADRRLRREQIGQRRQQASVAKAKAAAALAEAQAKAAELRRTLDEREEALRQARERREFSNLQSQKLIEHVAAAEARLSDLTSRLTLARAEEERLAARREALEQARADLNTFASGAKALLAAARDGRLNKIRGALADLLRVSPEYEIAISAALGSSLDAVVLDDLPTAEAALDLLQAEGGRAVLLPLDRLTPPARLPLPPDPDLIASAAELIECDPALRPAADVLIGRAVVVRSREAARRLLYAIPPEARLVTLDGEVHSATGAIVGGRDAGPALLARAREWVELPALHAQTQQNREGLEAQLQQTESEVEEARRARSAAAANSAEVESAEREALAARDAAHLAHERAAQAIGWRQEQLAALTAEFADLDRDDEALAAEIAALDEQRSAAEAEARNLSHQMMERSRHESELAQRRADLQTRAAVIERAVADASTHLTELERARAGAESLVNTRRFRLSTLEADASAIHASVTGHRRRAAAIDAQLDSLTAAIAPAQAQLTDLESRLAQHETGEDRARSGLHAAERRHAAAQLDYARKREELDALRRRIEEDFGLVELEYTDDVTGPTPLPLGTLVAKLPEVKELPEGIEDAIQRRRAQLRRMGAINPEAPAEYAEVQQRHDFLTTQIKDLETAAARLREVVAEMDLLMEREFRKTFDAVAAEFRETFTRLFGGGTAKLVLTDPDHLTMTGIDIIARLPGRRQQGLALLSGGERSLTASALIFALLRVSPTPFCVLDEVDAMLDEANVSRFREMLLELSSRTQFIIITHNRNTVQAADTVYGISMGADSASQVVSLKLEGERIAA